MRNLLILLLCFYVQAAVAEDIKLLTLKECGVLSAEINKNVPMIIDANTTLETTFCTSEKKRQVLNYRAYMNVEKSALRDVESGLAAMKKNQLNAWCTDPLQKELIQRADIRNIYYDIKRKYIGEIFLQRKDCNSVQ